MDPRRRAPAGRRLRRLLGHRAFPLVAALVGCALLAPSLGGGFQLDDHFQRVTLRGLDDRPALQLFVFYDGDPEHVGELIERGHLPWWTFERLRHASFRYVSVLTMQLDHLLWPERPGLMHLHSLLWLALLVVAVGRLYRQLAPAAWVAGLGVLLYAVDDAHALPAAYLANRHAMVATAFGALALLCFVRARRGWPPGRVLGPLCFALGLGGGETALATAGYLGAYALLLDRAPPGARLRALVPYGAVLALWALAFKLGGFGAEGSGSYVEPLRDPFAFVAALVERAPLLLLGQWTPFPADLLYTLGQDRRALEIGAWVSVGLLAALVVPVVRRDRVARFWALGMLLALVPVSAAGPQNRLLFFVGVGAMGLLAHLVHALVSGRGPAVWRVPAWACAALLLLVHGLLAPRLALQWLDIQAQSNQKMVRALESIPNDAAVAGQDLIFVNPPGHTYVVSGIDAFNRIRGRPLPRRLRALSAGTSGLEVERIDARTLEVRFPLGLFPTVFSRYYRRRDLPLRAGDAVAVSGLRAEVVRTNESGDPDLVRYRFEVPLEDSSLRWLAWQDGEFHAWTPPPVGESRELPPTRGIFEYDP